MQAEIITIGDELLMGLTVDTNSAWMGQFLTAHGFNVYQITSVSDNAIQIRDALDMATKRSDLVLVTGGLGPTSDDITKETLAGYFNMELEINTDILESIRKLLDARGLEMNENNRMQAKVPAGCLVLPNGRGTAPGMLFRKGKTIVISMPGVPYEMKDIMENQVGPYIKKNFNKDIIKYSIVMVYGTFEAKLAEILEPFEEQLPANVSLAYLPTQGIIKLRLTAKGKDETILDKLLKDQVRLLEESIPEFIYGYDGELLEEVTGKLLRQQNETCSVAESCTGGNISHMLTAVPGSSDYFRGGVVAYHNDIKTEELGVDPELIIRHGAVSREVAVAMAEGIRKKFNSDYAISTTGIAGPGGGSEEKPVGTVWIGISSASGSAAIKRSFGTERQNNIRRSSLAALDMLRRAILTAGEEA
ncbi:MAG: competence/damage-inducible protein A [Marinilabiliaceae bacterium]|jgi:nicotinamide-nucleotide amidase|nr:competence/damage-inducible protein A [Marinilabiliaceae bacterium]